MKMKMTFLIGLILLLIFPETSYSKDYSFESVVAFLDSIPNPYFPKNPEEDMTLAEIIHYHGYPLEEYDIITQDGYILTVHRIPYGKKNNTISKLKEPVLILPGLFAVSAVYVMNTPEKNLPYLLAENGYDVWLGNFRGTTFGRRHVHLSPKQKSFWNFSLDEMAFYDVPNTIDFILNKTDFDYLHCIGHSMGNTNIFATLSWIPDYNKKVRTFHALGPSIKLDHMTSPILLFSVNMLDFYMLIQDMIGNFEIFGFSPFMDIVMRTGVKWIPHVLISIGYHVLEQFNGKQFNWARLPVHAHFYPAGSSFKLALHYFQLVAHGRLQHYDYGQKGNKERYNQTVPPLYDITKITCPVAIYWAENDIIASKENAEFIIQNIRNVVLSYRVPDKFFTHEDFMLAVDVVPLVYKKLIETLNHLSKHMN